MRILLKNESCPSKEEYTVAVARFVNAYRSADPECAKEMLYYLGYSKEATEAILYTARTVTIRNL